MIWEILSSLFQLFDLLGPIASPLSPLLLLLHCLSLSESFFHGLTLALLVDVLELLAAGLEVAAVHLSTPVVFFPTLPLLEVSLALVESSALDLLAALLPRDWVFVVDGGGDDGGVGGDDGQEGGEGECECYELCHCGIVVRIQVVWWWVFMVDMWVYTWRGGLIGGEVSWIWSNTYEFSHM